MTAAVGSTSAELKSCLAAGPAFGVFRRKSPCHFHGRQNLASLDAAKVSKRIDVQNYMKAIETAFREVADALVASRSYTEQIGEESILVIAQQRRFELANLRYRQGEDTY